MHMSDALLSPAVGGAMWAATIAVGGRCVAVLRRAPDDRRVPLMGVLGAFVFAAQMVNFSIPGTGSSGHLGGGMLLAILLGPHAAFLVMASVLTIQALFFADGGLLALGCNVLNLAFFSSFVVYPLVFRPIAGGAPARSRVVLGAVVGSVAALALGAAGVVLETTASGISTLPAGPFALLMVPLHLAIGVVEGVVTGTVVLALWQARPELVGAVRPARSLRPVLVGLGAAVLLTGGVLSWFASQRPDGLEWSVAAASGGAEGAPSPVRAWLARVQGRTAILPDYGFAGGAEARRQAWPAVSGGTSLSGLLGAALVLGVALVAGALIRRARRR
jgi:cobalt/nickel transport system permease protein